MKTDDLMQKPYSEIHFGYVDIHKNGDPLAHGRIVGRDGATITVRLGDEHTDITLTSHKYVYDFESCDDVEAVKTEWSE